LKTHDVIIATVGSWPKNPASIVGKTICVPSEMNGALMNQNSVILRVKGECEIDQKYLFIALKTKLFSEYLVSTAQGSANQASVTLSDIFSYEVEWPDPAIRKSIVSMIDSVNQKIKLNRQTNQTLEHIAQTIFKSWFVDFEPTRAKIAAKQIAQARQDSERSAALSAALFADGRWPEAVAAAIAEGDPERAAMAAISGKSLDELDAHGCANAAGAGSAGAAYQLSPEQQTQLLTTAALFPDALVDSELGEIPDGWEFREAIDVSGVAIGKTPPRKEPQWFSEKKTDVRWVSIKDMGESGTYVQDTNEYLTEEAISKFNVRRIPNNTVILSFKMTVGRVAITDGEMLSNEAIAHFKLEDGASVFTEYLYLYLAGFDFESMGSTSSIATAVNSKMIKIMPVLVPSNEILDAFSECISPIFQEIKNLLSETKSLIEIRDTLLPQLLNGELSVKEDVT